MDTRDVALTVLLDIETNQTFSNIALGNALRKNQFTDKVERAFLSRLVEGVTETKLRLDYVIDQYSKTKIKKCKPVIACLLRMGCYQILFMDSVPDSAICNEAVKLAGKRGFVNLKGFVNGVLRNISRNLDKINYPDEKDKVSYLSVKYSLPEWLVKQWLNVYDEETVKTIGSAFLEEKPLTVRFNERKIKKEDLVGILKKEGVTVGEVPEIPCALYLSGYDHLSALPSFCEGLNQVQDLSSMQVALWSEVKEGDQVLDVCAAPGGKSIHIAELLNGTGHEEARDLTEYKVDLLRDNIERSGLTNIEAVCQDAKVYDPDKKKSADIVIADLPCSGLGVLGKKPDLRYKMNEKTEADLVELQRKILSVVKDYVKPDGKLLYSTCTIHREENEGNVEWFLKEYPEFELVKDKQMIPGKDAGDGFYIAIIKRVNHE